MEIWGWIIGGLLVASILFWLWQRRTIQATECGHKTKITGTLAAFGETRRGKVPVTRGKTRYCCACLNKMTIQCAWCSAPIFIGDHVTLYLAKKGVAMQSHAVEYIHKDGGNRSFIGCYRCADIGDLQGIWIPPGEVQRIPSATEIALAAIRQGAKAVGIRH